MLSGEQEIFDMQVFPPVFHSNPTAYGFALAGLLILTSLSANRIIHLFRMIDPKVDGWGAPITLYRLAKVGLFSTIFIGCFPDLAVLLAWNEIDDRTMLSLWAMDRLFDGMALIPFTVSIILLIRAEKGMVEQLRRPPLPVHLFMAWPDIRKQLAIVAMVILVAAGVSIGKINHVGCYQDGDCGSASQRDNG